jgi:hypothetical protein
MLRTAYYEAPGIPISQQRLDLAEVWRDLTSVEHEIINKQRTQTELIGINCAQLEGA